MLYFLMIIVLLLSGCVGLGKQSPPTPEEVSIISKAAAYIGLKEKNVSEKTADTINTVFLDVRVVLLTTLKEDPGALGDFTIGDVVSIPEAYVDLIDPTVHILLLRIRPLIGQGKTDLAAQYIEATLDGAMAGVAKYKEGLADANSLELKVA